MLKSALKSLNNRGEVMTSIKFYILWFLMLPFPLLAAETAIEVQKTPDVMSAGNIFQIVAALLVVLIMIVGAGWMMKRFGSLGGVSNGNLKVVAGITVGQREKIVIVQAGEVQVLIGISPGNVRTLHVLEKNISSEGDLESRNKNSKGFINHLKQQVDKREES